MCSFKGTSLSQVRHTVRMKAIIFTLLFVGAYAQVDDDVEIAEAQFPMSPMMNPMMMMGGMGGMGMGGMPMGGMPMSGMGGMPMSGMGEGYQTNYNLQCSNSCGCARMCVPMMPCNCVCPPRCPPQQTTPTPTPPEVSLGPSCENGAPGDHFPDCCFNGGRGRFCCQNGASNLHCCLNGANNPWCSLPTEPPVQAPPGGGNDCNQCQCQPCIPWVPCPPCPCQSRCGGFGK